MSIFDGLSYVQDVNSTNLEGGNERLREKLSSSENKFNFSWNHQNMLEQYDTRNNVFINENLTHLNNKIADNCRKLKHSHVISKTYMINGIVNLISDNIINGEPVKALRMEFLIYLFPNFELDLRNNEGDDENDLANESYQSKY